jgi:hypothetical protein
VYGTEFIFSDLGALKAVGAAWLLLAIVDVSNPSKGPDVSFFGSYSLLPKRELRSIRSSISAVTADCHLQVDGPHAETLQLDSPTTARRACMGETRTELATQKVAD